MSEGKRRTIMSKRIILGALSLLLMFTALYSQETQDYPKFYLQEKRVDTRNGNSLYVAVFVREQASKEATVNWYNPRMTVSTSFETYNQLMPETSYTLTNLHLMGVRFSDETEENLAAQAERNMYDRLAKRKAEQENEQRKKEEAVRVLGNASGEVISYVKSIAHPKEGKKVSFQELKGLESKFKAFDNAMDFAKRNGAIHERDAESEDPYRGTIILLKRALNYYLHECKAFLHDDKEGSLQKAIEILAGHEIAGIQRKNNMWKRAFRGDSNTWAAWSLCFMIAFSVSLGILMTKGPGIKNTLVAIGFSLPCLLIMFLIRAFL